MRNKRTYIITILFLAILVFVCLIQVKDSNHTTDGGSISNNFIMIKLNNKKSKYLISPKWITIPFDGWTTIVIDHSSNVSIENVTISNLQYVGSVGWYKRCDFGSEMARVDYYIASENERTFILAIARDTVVGYDGYEPKISILTTDWDGTLFDWEPKNEGRESKIAYTLTVPSNSGIGLVNVNYTTKEPICWLDLTSPDEGKVVTFYIISGEETIVSVSVCAVDSLPTTVYHDFEAIFKKRWMDTKVIDLNFSVEIARR